MVDAVIDAIAVITTKRDGGTLSDRQIDWMVDGFTRGTVSDEQMSALAMAILLRGMGAGEIAAWTEAMVHSGRRASYPGLTRPTVDKHSTGGVGDKITLVLTPLVAACGAAVPQLSGRGLGHTGGTLDKLEAIPGWRADLTGNRIRENLLDPRVSAVICAAGADLAPADRKLYALRDVTGTVESIPMIAASIMSKKIAEGTAALVLDVKVGSGAFLPGLDSARELAATMIDLGRAAGVRTSALLTDMDQPLGRAVGNALEVAEAVEVLAGGGPTDVVELTLALADEMLLAAGLDHVDPRDVLRDGRAMDRWRAVIASADGDPDAPLPTARHTEEVLAPEDGVLTALDAKLVGLAAGRLGAGRAAQGDPVSAGAGVVCHIAPGAAVRRGQPVATLYADDADRLPAGRVTFAEAMRIGPPGHAARVAGPLIIERMAADGPSA
ncbi:thymidine phosphorylase [Millisia brevis]|uniref:thymidine phosphorylase n=1 Tax=Millisia brevis TaxID=264148 RepID=UPI00082AB89E|nr:thymidine phosphorylase [Millisia brevis]